MGLYISADEAYPAWLLNARNPEQEIRTRARERARRMMTPPALPILAAPSPEPVAAAAEPEDTDPEQCPVCGRSKALCAAEPAPAPPKAKDPITVPKIMRAVAEFYQTSIRDLQSSRRERSICRPRQIAMYLGRELTLRSFPDIGQRVGGRDHTTVLHGWRKITALRAIDATLNAEIEAIIAALPSPQTAEEIEAGE